MLLLKSNCAIVIFMYSSSWSLIIVIYDKDIQSSKDFMKIYTDLAFKYHIKNSNK